MTYWIMFFVMVICACTNVNSSEEASLEPVMQDSNVLRIMNACDLNGHLIGEWCSEFSPKYLKLYFLDPYYISFTQNEEGIFSFLKLDDIEYSNYFQTACIKNDSIEYVLRVGQNNNIEVKESAGSVTFMSCNEDLNLKENFSSCREEVFKPQGVYYGYSSGPDHHGISFLENNKFSIFAGRDVSNSYQEVGTYLLKDDTIFCVKEKLNVFDNSFSIDSDGNYHQRLLETKKIFDQIDTFFIDHSFPEVAIYNCKGKTYNDDKKTNLRQCTVIFSEKVISCHFDLVEKSKPVMIEISRFRKLHSKFQEYW